MECCLFLFSRNNSTASPASCVTSRGVFRKSLGCMKLRKLSGHRIAVELTILAVLVASMAFVPPPAAAGSVGTGEIAMFPKQVAEFAYIDLKSARQYPWFLAFRNQLLPTHFHDFELLVSGGIDPNAQVDEVVWAQLPPTGKKGGQELVGIGFGSFDPSSNEERYKQQRLPVVEYQGYHLYNAGDILLTFLDSNRVAFGQRHALETLLDLRVGRGESLLTNDTLFPLITEMNGSGVIWAVFDKSSAPLAIQQLIPEVSLSPQVANIVLRLHAMIIVVDAGSGLDVRIQAVCGSVEDANLLGAFLQAGVTYRRYQQKQTSPDMVPDLAQDILESARLTPRGDRLQVEGSVSDDQLGALIKSKASAVPM